MEWSSSKKIKKWIGSWLLLGSILFICVILTSLYGETVKRKQLSRLLIEYPQMEAELVENFQKGVNDEGDTESLAQVLDEKYGYSIWSNVFTQRSILLWIIVYAGTTIIFILGLCLHEKKERLWDQEITERLLWLQQILEQLQEGDFGIHSYENGMAVNEKIDSHWDRLCGRVVELAAYFENVTHRLREEENNTKSLITDLSHQLKTPLASLKISHELAVSQQLTESEQKEFFQQEEYEIEKLGILLDELVKLSRLENHMIQIHTETADIKETITQAINQVYQKAYQKKIEIQVEMEENYKILHDRKWTVEAFVNVLDNAIKYSEEYTNINVRVQKMSMNLLIEIEDEGIGILSQESHKIFQRFYRGKDAAKFAKEGAGVGLALTRSIIEQQGGTITAKRKQKKGTIFRITLPL